jgi:hypothetical protein
VIVLPVEHLLELALSAQHSASSREPRRHVNTAFSPTSQASSLARPQTLKIGWPSMPSGSCALTSVQALPS